MKGSTRDKLGSVFVEDELRRYKSLMSHEKDHERLAKAIGTHLGSWIFRELPLSTWTSCVWAFYDTLDCMAKRYISDGAQCTQVAPVDKELILAILKFLQRIVSFSRRRQVHERTGELLNLLYFWDVEIVVEAYKAYILHHPYAPELKEIWAHNELLAKGLGLSFDQLKEAGLRMELNLEVPEDLVVGDLYSEEGRAMVRECIERYGRPNFIFEYRNILHRDNPELLSTLKILNHCALLVSVKGEGNFNTIAGFVDVVEIAGLIRPGISPDLEFAILVLSRVFIRMWYDFDKIDLILRLNDVEGLFQRLILERRGESSLERIFVFLVLKALVDNEKAEAVITDLLIRNMAMFKECSPDTRYFILYVLKIYFMDSLSEPMAAFFASDGMRVLYGYAFSVGVLDYQEELNLTYAFKLFNCIYTSKRLTNEKGVGHFEDSMYLLLLVSTVEKFAPTNPNLVIFCIEALAHFMFEEPLNCQVFLEKGAGVVLDVIPLLDFTLEHLVTMFSFIDAYSLNQAFQDRIMNEGHLLKLLAVVRDSEFALSRNGSTDVIRSSLMVLVMHHPRYKEVIIEFFHLEIRYLKNVLSLHRSSIYGSADDPANIFEIFYDLMTGLNIALAPEEADGFLSELTELVLSARYSYGFPTLFENPFRRLYVDLFKMSDGRKRILEAFVRAGSRFVELCEGAYDWRGRSPKWITSSGIEHAGPPSYTRGDVAERALSCTMDGAADECDEDERVEALAIYFEKSLALLLALCDNRAEFLKIPEDTRTECFSFLEKLFFSLTKFHVLFNVQKLFSVDQIFFTYKSTRSRLRKAADTSHARRELFLAIFLGTSILVQRFVCGGFVDAEVTLIEFIEKFIKECIGKEDKEEVVLGLYLMQLISSHFQEAQLGVCCKEEILEKISSLKLEDGIVTVTRFLTCLASEDYDQKMLIRRHIIRFLECVTESYPDVCGPGHVEEDSMNNSVIKALNIAFGGEEPIFVVPKEDLPAVMRIFNRVANEHTRSIKIGDVLWSKKYRRDILRTHAFSGYKHFMGGSRRVYSNACRTINTVSQPSDRYIELLSYVVMFATTKRCPHMISLGHLTDVVLGYLPCASSAKSLLSLLTSYYRLARTIDAEPVSIDFRPVVSRLKTFDELSQMAILCSYIVCPDLRAMTSEISFPSTRVSEIDVEFFRANFHLIYRNYDFFICEVLLHTKHPIYADFYESRMAPGRCKHCPSHDVACCHPRYPFDKSAFERKWVDEVGRGLVEALTEKLSDDDACNASIQLLAEVILNSPIVTFPFIDTRALRSLFEKHITTCKAGKGFEVPFKSHWAMTLFTLSLYSEVSINLKLGRSEEAGDEGSLAEEERRKVSNIIFSYIRDGSSSELASILFLLVRSLTPLLISFHDAENYTNLEKFKAASEYLKGLGIFDLVFHRINAMSEGDAEYQQCMESSVDYLCKSLKYCYEEVDNIFNRERLAESEDSSYQDSGEAYLFGESYYSDEQSFSSEAYVFEEDESDESLDEGSTPESDSEDTQEAPEEDRRKEIEQNYEIHTMQSRLEFEFARIPWRIRDAIEQLLENMMFRDLIGRSNFYDREPQHKDGAMAISSEKEAGVEEQHVGAEEESCGLDMDGSEEFDIGSEDMSQESELGVENGEMPSLSPDVLNAMNDEELKHVLDEYFNNRRSHAMTYVPLSTAFYGQLSDRVRAAFEEMERVYREGFFYDIQIQPPQENEAKEENIRIKVENVDLSLYRRFVLKCIEDKDFPFTAGWELVELLSYDEEFQRAGFDVVSEVLCNLREMCERKKDPLVLEELGSQAGLTEDRSSQVFKRSLRLLVDIVKDGKGYEAVLQPNPGIVSTVLEIFESRKPTLDLVELLRRFSVVFTWDKACVFDKGIGLKNICTCFTKSIDLKWHGHIEEFVKNTCSHFYAQFSEAVYDALQARVLRLEGQLSGALFKRPVAEQNMFLYLCKLLHSMTDKVEECRVLDERFVKLLSDPFWLNFGRFMNGRELIKELLQVSYIYESYFLLGKVLELKSRRAEPGAEDALKESYKKAIEAQSTQLNILIANKPDDYFMYLNSFVDPTILNFSNKKNYFHRELRADRGDKQRPPYGVFVDRKNVLRTSYFQIMAKSPAEFRERKIEIKLAGEEGLDYGGITREWLGLLVKDLVNPDFALFTFASEEKNTVVPCKGSFVNPEHLSYFKFVGRIMAKAIIDNNSIGLHLTRYVYKYILSRPCDLSDLELADPAFYNSLIWVRDNPIDGVLHLTFSLGYEEFGESRTVDLVPNGSQISVTEENKLEYIRLLCEYKLFNGIELQLSALKSGLLEILREDIVRIFDEHELELLICGIPEINVDDWKSNTLYFGYKESSKVITWFWKAVKSFSDVSKAKLLQFVTGSSMLPYEGFSHLQGNNEIQKFSIHRISAQIDSLPTAHTCFNQLNLPDYSSYENLLKCLTLAINECATGFGFI
jgi:hypothetical protein